MGGGGTNHACQCHCEGRSSAFLFVLGTANSVSIAPQIAYHGSSSLSYASHGQQSNWSFTRDILRNKEEKRAGLYWPITTLLHVCQTYRVAGWPWAPEISTPFFPCVPGIRISFFPDIVLLNGRRERGSKLGCRTTNFELLLIKNALYSPQTPTAAQRQTTRGKTCCFVTHIPNRNFDPPQPQNGPRVFSFSSTTVPQMVEKKECKNEVAQNFEKKKHFFDVHFSLGEKQILETRCIKQHAFFGRSTA